MGSIFIIGVVKGVIVSTFLLAIGVEVGETKWFIAGISLYLLTVL